MIDNMTGDNETYLCGISNWEVNVPQEVSGCQSLEIPDTGTQLGTYFFLTDNGTLRFNGGDFSDNGSIEFPDDLGCDHYAPSSQGVYPQDLCESQSSSSSTPGITVNVISDNTTEAGGTASFTVVLDSEPSTDVTIPISSGNVSEGTVSVSSLTFTSSNWSSEQTVTVTGVDDSIVDDNATYNIVIGAATSSDSNYNGMDAGDVVMVNEDNSPVCVVSGDNGSTSSISISGYVKDGITGNKLSGTVNLYDSTGITLLDNSSVSSSSKYSFADLTPGTYVLKPVATDYVSVTDTRCLTSSNNSMDLIALTSSQATNANVTVLTWGDSNSGAPADLDSGLLASGGSPSPTHIKYNARGSSSAWAMLDLDDTQYSGPETIRINLDSSSGPLRNGVTKACYYVSIYTNGYSFSQTKAQVQLFQSDGTVLTNFEAPDDTNASDQYWHVFDLDSNLNITTRNTVSVTEPTCN